MALRAPEVLEGKVISTDHTIGFRQDVRQEMSMGRSSWTAITWIDHIGGLVQDSSNSSVLAMELLQSCAKLIQWQIAVTPVASFAKEVNPPLA